MFYDMFWLVAYFSQSILLLFAASLFGRGALVPTGFVADITHVVQSFSIMIVCFSQFDTCMPQCCAHTYTNWLHTCTHLCIPIYTCLPMCECARAHWTSIRCWNSDQLKIKAVCHDCFRVERKFPVLKISWWLLKPDCIHVLSNPFLHFTWCFSMARTPLLRQIVIYSDILVHSCCRPSATLVPAAWAQAL